MYDSEYLRVILKTESVLSNSSLGESNESRFSWMTHHTFGNIEYFYRERETNGIM